MDCVLAGTSLTRMTSTGRVVRDKHRPFLQVLPLGTAVTVSSLTILLVVNVFYLCVCFLFWKFPSGN